VSRSLNSFNADCGELIRVRAATLAADAEFAEASLLRLTPFVLSLLKSNWPGPLPASSGMNSTPAAANPEISRPNNGASALHV
jgi:hypothetical protein